MFPSLHSPFTIHRGVLLVLRCSTTPPATLRRNDSLCQNPWCLAQLSSNLNDWWGLEGRPEGFIFINYENNPRVGQESPEDRVHLTILEILLEAYGRYGAPRRPQPDEGWGPRPPVLSWLLVMSAVQLKVAHLGQKGLRTVITGLVKQVLQVLKKPENRTKAKKYKSLVQGSKASPRYLRDITPCSRIF